MIEGPSGILKCSDPSFRPVYQPSLRQLAWPNGAIATTFSADVPEQLRGPGHDAAWVDELAAWNLIGESEENNPWDQLMFGLREGDCPQCVVTTTPKPKKLIRELCKDPTVHITRGSTYDNVANLAGAFAKRIIAKYEGTTVGRQELEGELLEQLPGSLWHHAMIDVDRITYDAVPDLVRVSVGVDPAVTSSKESAETGIVGVGRDDQDPCHYYILSDRSLRASPGAWAQRAISALSEINGDRLVAEVNNGGDLVETNIRTVSTDVPYTAVRASRGKRTRAEPIASLYEQHRVHHVGVFAELEDQMCNWIPGEGDSPDRVDALVWGITDLSNEVDSWGFV